MPSPIAHVTAGAFIARAQPVQSLERRHVRRLWALCLFFSIAPDLDVVAGLAFGNMHGYHNGASHSLLVALLVCALATPPAARWIPALSRFRLFGVMLLCYGAHVGMDWMTRGRGVMLAWPLSDHRFRFPLPLFYGVRWSEGLVSGYHLITLANEILWIIAIIAIVGLRRRLRNA